MTSPVEPRPSDTPTPAGDPAAPAAAPQDGTPPEPRRKVVVEEKMPAALWVRVLIYVVGAHFFAGFLYLLFVLGAHNQ
ncbi:DUF6126 family protein [Streptomyces sp. NPDC050560]|uniref:DUF6126 family protein n=1 Tax=Streptomyces sp. NPDC050560 TaxID=3365630 RepID=UPI00378D33E9